jgi:predicted DNA binding CopG/RHH family protein
VSEVWRFTREQLERGKVMAPAEVLGFLETYRKMHLPRKRQKSTLISLKLPDALLRAFKGKAQLSGVAYQSQIKTLMRQWLGQGLL